MNPAKKKKKNAHKIHLDFEVDADQTSPNSLNFLTATT